MNNFERQEMTPNGRGYKRRSCKSGWSFTFNSQAFKQMSPISCVVLVLGLIQCSNHTASPKPLEVELPSWKMKTLVEPVGAASDKLSHTSASSSTNKFVMPMYVELNFKSLIEEMGRNDGILRNYLRFDCKA